VLRYQNTDTVLHVCANVCSPHHSIRGVSASSAGPAKEFRIAPNGRHLQHLRFQLVQMLQVSLKSVDYATKAYALGFPEFARHALSERNKLQYLSEELSALTDAIREEVPFDSPQEQFTESALRIAMELLVACDNAYDIAVSTTTLTRAGLHSPTSELVRLGEQVNGLLRLCTVAFLNASALTAKAVLHQTDNWRHQRAAKRSISDLSMSVRKSSEEAITDSLWQMMENVRAIALQVTKM
jgi:hypothetical protein